MGNVLKKALIGDALVVASVDWFSGVFYDVSIAYVFEDFLGLNDAPYMNSGWVETFTDRAWLNGLNRFDWNGIRIKYSAVDFAIAVERKQDPFRVKMKAVEVELSGEGLRYMRHVHPDFDVDLRDICMQASQREDGLFGFHPTRFDLAFDFFNYKVLGHDGKPVNIYDAWCNYLTSEDMRSVTNLRRLDDVGKCGNCNLSYTIQCGAVRSVTFGLRNTSEKLRVYDKMLERGGIHSEDLPFEVPVGEEINIDSWIRIELETRERKNGKGVCQDYFYALSTDIDRLRKLVDRFTFVDPFTKKPLTWWQDWFNWDSIGGLIQNAKSVEYRESRDKLIDSYHRWLRQGQQYLGAFGPRTVLSDLEYVRDIMCSDIKTYSYRTYINRVYILIGCDFDTDGNVIRDVDRLKKCSHLQYKPYSHATSPDPDTGEVSYLSNMAWSWFDDGIVNTSERLLRGFVDIDKDI